MNTNPTTQRAADVIAERLPSWIRWCRQQPDAQSYATAAAEALAAAGLLADRTTPQPTDEQAAVIEAAVSETWCERDRLLSTAEVAAAHDRRRVAVDRLLEKPAQ